MSADAIQLEASNARSLLEGLEFESFHRDELPSRLASRSAMPPAYAAGLKPLALRIAGCDHAVTYRPDADGGIALLEGERADTVVELELDAWRPLVWDLESVAGLMYHQRMRVLRGDAMHFLRWEPALRWAYTGRPVYDEAQLALRTADGSALDPAHGFRLGDDPGEMAHFLRTAGYLWLRGVLAPDEIAALRVEAAELESRAVQGDQESWWGRNEAGDAVLCRVLRAGQLPHMRALKSDARILQVIGLCDQPMQPSQPADAVDGVTVLWKRPGVAEGLADLPWHRDCGMGGHASMCPTAVFSLFLGPNTPEAGELRFLPGSWQASLPFFEPGERGAPEGVSIPAEPGDLTLHYGDGMHVAPAPTSSRGPFRTCILMGFQRRGAWNHRGDRHYNDVLLGDEDGQVVHMRKMAERV